MAVRPTMAPLINRVRLLIALNVGPNVAVTDITNSRTPYIKLFSYLSVACALLVKLADLKYLLISQFSLWVRFAFTQIAPFGVDVPVFPVSIGAIISSSAEEEVFGINTRWIITAMANKHAFWYRTICKFISNAASNTGFSINFDGAIFLFKSAFCCGPVPASIFTTASIAMHNQPCFNLYTVSTHCSYSLNYVLSCIYRIPHINRTVKEVG